MNKNIKIIFFFSFLISGLLGFWISLYMHSDHSVKIQEPVKIIQTFHYPATFVNQIKGDPEAGKKIFNQFCGVCHNKVPMIAIHAPRIGDKKIWTTLNKLGINLLLKITIEGKGAMPARGGCFECSDHQLQEAIQYILDQSLPKKM